MDKKSDIRISFKWLAIIIICCLGAIAYSNTFNNSFQFDDYIFIRNNPNIRKLANLKDIWGFSSCRFLAFFTFALNYYLHQFHVFGYHLFNLLVHLGSAMLTWWFILLTFFTPVMKNKRISQHAHLIAFFAGLIFVAHPIQTEAVTYIFQRVTSLAAFFYLFSLCLYIKSRLLEINGSPVSKWIIPYVFSWLMAVASMFTKENAFTLPLMIILYEFCFFGTGKHIKYKYSLPFLILLPVIPAALFSTKPVTTFENIQPLLNQPLHAWNKYLLTQFRVMVTYLRLLFLPLNQNLDYDYPLAKSLWELPVLFSFLFLVFILFTAMRIFSRYRLFSFAIFWFFLTLMIESSVIPLVDVIYEHRLYLPMVGYSLFLVNIIYYLLGRKSLKLMALILIIVVQWYAISTYLRNFVWKDRFTLWNDAVLKSPQKARPHNNRGLAYAFNGDYISAIRDYNKAIEINPDYAIAYHDRAIAYADIGKPDQAILDYTKAIEINPKFALAYNNRGIAHAIRGEYNQAIFDFTKAIELNPRLAFAYRNRATVYFSRGEFNKSWEDVQKAETLGYRVEESLLKALTKALKRKP